MTQPREPLMGRIRTIKPEFFRSRSLAKVAIPVRLTFIGLWTEADDLGRGIADVDVLRGVLWPKEHSVDAGVLETHLAELVGSGHIRLYEVDDERYFEVINWEKHQAAAYRRGEARYPAPADSCGLHVPARLDVLERGTKNEERGRAADLSVEFDAWWASYPRKNAKKDAERAYRKARQSASADQLASGLQRSVNQWRRENRPDDKLPHAATWLNGARWLDDFKPAKTASEDAPWT